MGCVPTGKWNSATGARERPRTIGGSVPFPAIKELEPNVKFSVDGSVNAKGRMAKLPMNSPGDPMLKMPRPTVRLLTAMTESVAGRFSDQIRKNQAPVERSLKSVLCDRYNALSGHAAPSAPYAISTGFDVSLLCPTTLPTTYANPPLGNSSSYAADPPAPS